MEIKAKKQKQIKKNTNTNWQIQTRKKRAKGIESLKRTGKSNKLKIDCVNSFSWLTKKSDGEKEAQIWTSMVGVFVFVLKMMGGEKNNHDDNDEGKNPPKTGAVRWSRKGIKKGMQTELTSWNKNIKSIICRNVLQMPLKFMNGSRGNKELKLHSLNFCSHFNKFSLRTVRNLSFNSWKHY